jgi:hypothetical protein
MLLSGTYEILTRGVFFSILLFLSLPGFAQVKATVKQIKPALSTARQVGTKNSRIQQECDAVFMVHFKALQENSVFTTQRAHPTVAPFPWEGSKTTKAL